MLSTDRALFLKSSYEKENFVIMTRDFVLSKSTITDKYPKLKKSSLSKYVKRYVEKRLVNFSTEQKYD